MTKNLTKRFKIVRIIAYETLLGECVHFQSMIFVSHYMFIIFLSVLMSLDISVPTVLSDNTPFVESIFIFYLHGAEKSEFLLFSSKESLLLSVCLVSKYSTTPGFIKMMFPT